jgi:uncharacterized protein YbaR (Trm112 family)
MDRKLLELLICPVTQGPLEYDKEHQVLISQGAKLVFPIHDGIPIMLETEAVVLDEWVAQGKPHANQMKAPVAASAPDTQEHAPENEAAEQDKSE